VKPNQSNGKWWLAAILFPVFGFGGGFFCLIAGPRNQGWGALAVIFLGLFSGCVLSMVAAAISAVKREKLCGIALLAGIPSLIFVLKVCVEIPRAAKSSRLSNEHFLAHQKQVEEQEARVICYREEFRTNSSLITNDDFWNAQSNQDHSAQDGLDRLIEDQSYKFTPEINEYIIKKFPGRTEGLMQNKRLSQGELIKIIKDVQHAHKIRETGVYVLISDRSFNVTDDWKKYIIEKFPNEIGDLLLDKRFTKNEVEALLADPTIDNGTKEIAKRNLREKNYKK
jgi:hypothetical protein